MSTQIQPNVPARSAVVYTGGDSHMTASTIAGSIKGAWFLVAEHEMGFDTPQEVVEIGADRLFKITIEEVGTTE